MSKRIWILTAAVLVVTGIMILETPVKAQMYNPDEDLPKATYAEKSLNKLGRGLSNVMLGWAEVPVTFDKNLKKGKSFGYLFGVAPVLGTARAAMRTGTGVYEVVSFPVSDKKTNFDPIIEPEFIF
jgi:putative exosortase-associated protein (TIGR04073 family)